MSRPPLLPRPPYRDYVYRADVLNATLAAVSVLLAVAVVWMVWHDHDRQWKAYQRRAQLLDHDRVAAQLAAAADPARATELGRRRDRLSPAPLNRARDLPFIDVVDPILSLRQVALPHLHNDFHSARPPRLDRCVSCHVNAARPAYAVDAATGAFADSVLRTHMEAAFPDEAERRGWTRALGAHPRLDLYLSDASPHPLEGVGCTICHRGRDRGTSFAAAAHTPADREQAAAWRRAYNWAALPHWEQPMLPRDLVQASCAECHRQEWTVPEAPVASRGNALMRARGCYGCHAIPEHEGLPVPGPDLGRLGGKVTADWVARYIREPQAFAAGASMPRVFDLANTSDTGDRGRSAAMAAGIGAYLAARAAGFARPPAPAGDASRGAGRLEDLGCLGCHLLDATPAQIAAVPAEDPRRAGPDLSSVGSKLGAGWLHAWLRDPRSLAPHTRMPDLRLTVAEAADVTAFLLTRRNRAWEDGAIEPVDETVRDGLVQDFMALLSTPEEAGGRAASLSKEERLLYLGERAIAHYGCYGCHAVPGFEAAQPIGVDLADVGDRNLHHLDFGAADLPRTRRAWLLAKMQTPRRFDVGLGKPFLDRLRHPDFGIDQDEARALTTALLGLRPPRAAAEAQRGLSPAAADVEAGRRHVETWACRACHQVDGRDGELREHILARRRALGDSRSGAAEFVPPSLDGVGRRLQPQWLYTYLDAPAEVRPWHSARMPTYGFADSAITDLAAHLARRDSVAYPFVPAAVPLANPLSDRGVDLLMGPGIFDCWTCHQRGEVKPRGDRASWAPDLVQVRHRIRPAWLPGWLRDPQGLAPGTRMPAYFSGPQTYLPEDASPHLPPGPDGRPYPSEYGVVQPPTDVVVGLLVDHILHGLHRR